VNRRTAARARIKRASAKAQVKLRRIDADSQNQLIEVYSAARDDIQQQIINSADGGGIVRRQAMQSLLVRVNQRLDSLSASRDALLGRNIRTAADNGLSAFQDAGLSINLNNISDDAVRLVAHQVAEDGLQLSDRLWRNQLHAKEVVGRSIQNAIIQGHSASEAARNFIAQGQSVPLDIMRREGAAKATSIAKSTGAQLMTGKGSPLANAKRLFRTEINRAHGEAYKASAQQHPDAIGTRFLLSPQHRETDICDMHAKVNRYGLGAGVYPFGKSPWPAHPNTLSFEVIVFKDEVSDADKSGKEDRLQWLGKQTPGTQEGVLASRKKRAALQAGVLKEGQISTPWAVLKKRYQRQGIDVDNLNIKVGPAAAVGKPVSAAVSAQSYKAVTKDVLAAIDRVHGDGVLPSIPVKRSSSKKFEAAYRHIPSQRRPVEVLVTSHTSAKEFSLAHELGHFIDNQAFKAEGKYLWASADHPDFEEWRQAVAGSKAVQNLVSMTRGPKKIPMADGFEYEVDKKHLSYLLQAHEIWARSYSQFIAQRGGSAAMSDQLQRWVARERTGQINYTSQWEEQDFKPIAKAIEALFIKRGWMQ